MDVQQQYSRGDERTSFRRQRIWQVVEWASADMHAQAENRACVTLFRLEDAESTVCGIIAGAGHTPARRRCGLLRAPLQLLCQLVSPQQAHTAAQLEAAANALLAMIPAPAAVACVCTSMHRLVFNHGSECMYKRI
jgi:hypothetical protein